MTSREKFVMWLNSVLRIWNILYDNPAIIYIINSKNIRYLLWNRGAWRFFHDTYLTIEVPGIRCTNHLHESCPFTDVNPHFTAPGCRYYFKINSWRPIVTSYTHGPAASYCDVTMTHGSHGYLWTHDVEVGALLGLTSLFSFLFIFGHGPVFQHGASLVHINSECFIQDDTSSRKLYHEANCFTSFFRISFPRGLVHLCLFVSIRADYVSGAWYRRQARWVEYMFVP